jgi:hypothetical protein
MKSKEWPVLIGEGPTNTVAFFFDKKVLQDNKVSPLSRGGMEGWLDNDSVKQLKFIPKEFI